MKSFCFLALALLAVQSYAANWYVKSASSGSSSGSDWSNAWSISNLNSNWSKVSAGDTIWIAGGTYSTGINCTKSGTAGNPITIKRVTASDTVPKSAAGWSSSFDSQVVITPKGSSPVTFGTNNTAFVTIDGRTPLGMLLRYDNSADAFMGAISITGNGVNNINVSYCDLAGPGGASGYFYNGDNAPLNIRNTGSPQCHHITISYCTLRGGPNLIRSLGDSYITIEYSILKDNVSSNSAIHGNVWYNETGTNNTFRFNDLSGWEVEGIIMWDAGANGPWWVYGNVFHDPVGGTNGVASCFWPGSNTSNSAQGPLYLYNNTFVNCNITTAQSRSWQFASGSISRNNIFWNSTFASNSRVSDSDYNFSDKATPGDHSISSGTNPFVNSAAKDYQIISTVGAKLPRNKGITLDSAYNLDLFGVLRGQDSSWDMGATEVGAASGLLPPSNALIDITVD